MTWQLSSVAIVWAEGDWLNSVGVCEPTLLLVAMTTATSLPEWLSEEFRVVLCRHIILVAMTWVQGVTIHTSHLHK